MSVFIAARRSSERVASTSGERNILRALEEAISSGHSSLVRCFLRGTLLDLQAPPPLPIPRLAGGVSETTLPALLIASARRTHLLPARLLRTAMTAVALPAVTDRADRNLSVTSDTEEQPVVRTRVSPGCPGTRRRSASRRYCGQNAVVTPCSGTQGGSTG